MASISIHDVTGVEKGEIDELQKSRSFSVTITLKKSDGGCDDKITLFSKDREVLERIKI